ncbi:hypothetical protein [Alicyclobacillus sp. ALC3]|uniref:hypothetical protein n=1 Tax=Alicyclobacillus sp. ALC3 TaxID=2796143 RepID=UPI002379F6B7|nr:hypothetical protein [Alicyclobacillus sp. ALC3]WDL96944.1 hypothetical protein JC200_22140 [Alicyclobacillus sp. ALC3]
MFSIQVDDKITPYLDGVIGTVGDAMSALVRQTADVLTPFLQQQAPVGQHYGFDGSLQPGGELRSSLNWAVGMYGAKLEGAKQGEYVIGGTAPHEITPRAKSALAFYWPKVGAGVMFGHVNHPGTQPNDFRWKAIQQAFDELAIKDVTLHVMLDWLDGGAF